MTTSGINTLPAPQSAAERHNRLGNKIGVALGAVVMSLGAAMAYAGNKAVRYNVADVAAAAPGGSELVARARLVSDRPVIVYEYVNTLRVLARPGAPGKTPNAAQAKLDSANNSLFGKDVGLAIVAAGAAAALSGSKLRKKS